MYFFHISLYHFQFQWHFIHSWSNYPIMNGKQHFKLSIRLLVSKIISRKSNLKKPEEVCGNQYQYHKDKARPCQWAALGLVYNLLVKNDTKCPRKSWLILQTQISNMKLAAKWCQQQYSKSKIVLMLNYYFLNAGNTHQLGSIGSL